MEKFLTIGPKDRTLSAVLHSPANSTADHAVIIVVGGPQYRVGSHRMFVRLARAIAAAGLPVLRFDFQGMGESDGTFPGFDAVSEDLKVATDAMLTEHPECKTISLIGLCDGASAAAIYANQDDRVTRLVLLNPWVHTEAGEAKAFVWYYYPRRLLRLDFWRGVFTGKVNVFKAVGGLLAKVKQAFAGSGDDVTNDVGFIERMRRGLAGFNGEKHFLLSDTDLTAAEFRDLVKQDVPWSEVVPTESVTS
ncbi:MAG: hydrolase 1, exosortase A system-associated, partial [Woeseiaceae bacterium]